MKKIVTPLNLMLVYEVIMVGLMMAGILPRLCALSLAGVILFYLIFAPLMDSLFFFVASIPLFVALPLTDDFDAMSSWRIFLLALFFVWLIKALRDKNYDIIGFIKKCLKDFLKSKFGLWVLIFLVIGVLSLLGASYKISGLKKILYLINVFMLYVLVIKIVRKKTETLRIIKAGILAGILSFAVGYLQFVTVFLVSLYSFWQYWADKVIALFYGQKLSNLLSYSNTWFSYYGDRPPTLRMFSVFPDSHSFALFGLLSIPFFLAFITHYQAGNKKRLAIAHWLLVILGLFAIVLSGSRGVWVSVIPAVGTTLYLFFKKKTSGVILKKGLISFFIFLLLLPISSLILAQTQRSEGELEEKDSLLTFKRISSIADMTEISNKSRMDIWKRSLESIMRHPLFGVGIGNFPVVLGEEISASRRGASAHNLYLDIAAEMGVFALVIVLIIFFKILKTFLQIVRKRNDLLLKTYALIFGLYFSWLLVYSFFDVVLLNDKVLLFFMVGLGILSQSAQWRKNLTEEYND